MFLGQFSLCLATKDVPAMRRFYETLGFKVHIDNPSNNLMNNGDIDIALMNFLDQHCFNFRGADAIDVKEAGEASGYKFKGKARRFDGSEREGSGWIEYSPDGNNVFFDTNGGEIGEKGYNFMLQRVLDATAKMLINVGASDECRKVFQSSVREKFMPQETRAVTDLDIDTSLLTDPGTFPGFFTYCFKTSDNSKSAAFWEALGLDVNVHNDSWASVGNGDCHFDLMTFLGADWLNFRGGDVFELYDRLKTAGFELEGEPTRYTSEEMGGSAPGKHWQTKDPDGNVVYFDTTDPELITPGDPKSLRRVLLRAERQLQNIDAREDVTRVFQAEILHPFLPAEAA